MGRKNSPSAKKELVTLITNYEEAKLAYNLNIQ